MQSVGTGSAVHFCDACCVGLQELFERAEEMVRADPSKYAFKNIEVAVLLRRTKRRPSVDIGWRSTE